MALLVCVSILWVGIILFKEAAREVLEALPLLQQMFSFDWPLSVSWDDTDRKVYRQDDEEDWVTKDGCCSGARSCCANIGVCVLRVKHRLTSWHVYWSGTSYVWFMHAKSFDQFMSELAPPDDSVADNEVSELQLSLERKSEDLLTTLRLTPMLSDAGQRAAEAWLLDHNTPLRDKTIYLSHLQKVAAAIYEGPSAHVSPVSSSPSLFVFVSLSGCLCVCPVCSLPDYS